MTCVIALRDGDEIYMGADSAGVSGTSLQIRKDPKIYRVRATPGEMLVGYTTSFRMGQILGYSLTPPIYDPATPLERYMVTTFIDAVRDALKRGGVAKKDNEVESGGDFLIAY